MSKVSNNSNYNKVSVKTDSTVELIQELSKLGVFKGKRKPRKRASTAGGDIRQDGPMAPGFTKNLGGPQMRNLPPIQQIQSGMTDQQITDIQRTNNATIAALTGEIRQQRLQDIEAQQGQRFEDITKLGGIINPLLERFRGSTFPAQASGDQPIDPFASSRGGGVIYLGNEPDVTEERFTQTLNEGGPEAVEEEQTTVFAGDNEALAVPEPRIQPDQKIGGGPRKTKSLNLRRTVTTAYQLPPIPQFKGTTTADMLEYYKLFTNGVGYDANQSYFTSKEKMFQDINEIADEIALSRTI
jgi:hypothetical protein